MALEFAEWALVRDLHLTRKLHRLAAGIHTEVGALRVTVATSPEPVPFADRHTLRQRPIKPGGSWGGAFTCAWFHVTGQVPAGHPHPALLLDTDGEALVRNASGEILAALTSRVTFIEQRGSVRGKTRLDLDETTAPGGRIDLWLDAGFNGKLQPPYGWSRVKRLAMVAVDDDLEGLYYDLLTVAAAARCAPAPHRQRYADAEQAAWHQLADALPSQIARARQTLRPLIAGAPDTDLTLTAVGHGHLDLAWLWPLRETRRKSERTLVAQLALLDRYPESHYGVSQPQQLAWLAERNPGLLARVQDQIAAGRIEAQGGMWVESDTNLPSGESLVRQMLIGQRYWRELTGDYVRTCWLPDAFGYSGNLPQLIRGAAMDYFVTIKLAWNEVTVFPHRSFRWRGIDGSEVLVHMPPEGTYNSSATPQSLLLARKNYSELPVTDRALLVYGSGDGGGGPGPTHLELLRRGANLTGFPAVVRGRAVDALDELAKVTDQLPVWDGELYLQKHQGTYTTQAAVKRGNRRLEHLLHDVEYLATMAWVSGGRAWPSERLRTIWRDVLLHQFHDMLPGSSIARVHRETRERYAELEAELTELTAELVACLTGDPSDHAPWFANTLSTARHGHVQVDQRWYRYDAEPHTNVQLVPAEPASGSVDEHTMVTDELRVRWRSDGAAIESLVTPHDGREYCGDYLNRLIVHPDPLSYFDAWDIRAISFNLPRKVLRPDSVETFVDGPRLVRRSHYRTRRSTITQDAVAQAGVPYLLFETSVDWHETWRMLRTESNPAHWSPEINCEIQFGHIARTTSSRTPEERAQIEICAHQWVDMSTADAGLALLNDSKYGHRAKDGRLSINLLRSPVYPDRTADRGEHHFSYAIYPHAGDLRASRTIELARDLNAPGLLTPGPLPHPVAVDPGSVEIVAVKRSEDGDDVIVRLNETAGRPASVGLRFGFAVADITEVNLLEEPSGGRIDAARLDFTPFQVRTLRIRRA